MTTMLHTADPAHVRDIEAWRTRRLERLTAADGWLSLAGLFWLNDGEQRFGAAADNDVVFPKGPRYIGTLSVSRGQVTLRSNPGMTLSHNGMAVTHLQLVDDAQGAPSIIELGALSFNIIRRGDKLAVRLRDAQSPTRTGFRGLPSYAIDTAWRIEARFTPYEPAREIAVPNVQGSVGVSISPGALEWDADGATYRLDAVLEPGREQLFIIFADATNGKETYGAGRFVYTDLPRDGRVVLDFNKAYNPPCAFTPFATCPLPPPQNRLPIAIRAGEKRYAAH